MPINCIYDSHGCLVCPAIDATPGTPETVALSDNLGWNAGGESFDPLTGDVHYVFTMAKVVGAVTGFKATYSNTGNPSVITHGFGFQSSAGLLLWFIVENGFVVNHGGAYDADDEFEIRRIGDHVAYYHAGVKVYQSQQLSTGYILIGGCLYAAGDAISETVFEAYSLTTGDADAGVPGFAALGWKGKLASIALPLFGIASSGHDIASVSIAIPAFETQAWIGNRASVEVPGFEATGWSFQAPAIALGYAQIPGFTVSAAAHRIVYAEPDIEVPLFTALGFKGKWASAAIPGFAASGDDHNPFATGIVFALQSSGVAFSQANASTTAMTFLDGLVETDVISTEDGWYFKDNISAATMLSSLGTRGMVLADSAHSTDFLEAIKFLVLSESVAAADTFGVTKSMLLAFADALAATDSLLTQRDALMVIASAIVASDFGSPFDTLNLNEDVAATDQLLAKIHDLLKFADTVTATDSLTGVMSLIMILNDEVQGEDQLTQFRHALMSIDDAFFVGGHFSFGGVDYVIYAMQPIGAAVSEYRNFNFDSGFVVDGVAYGTSENGVFVLEGSDDDGAPIISTLYTGLSSFGSSMEKDCPQVVIGYNGAGNLRVKVFTTNSKGKKENWYKLSSIERGATVDARFTPSKGLHAEYFGFELTNEVDGGDFDVDYMKVWIRPLNRRVQDG